MFFGKYDPDKIQKLMEQFGIKSDKLVVKEVTIKLKDKTLTLKNPDVLLTYVMDREVYQISAKEKKETKKKKH